MGVEGFCGGGGGGLEGEESVEAGRRGRELGWWRGFECVEARRGRWWI